MATSSTFGHLRPAAFVVRRLAGKGSPGLVRLVKAAAPRGERMQMTKAEAEVFFAACEAPFKAEINVFEHLPEVAQWFNKSALSLSTNSLC